MLMEVCVDNIISVRNAFKGGADRIELCSSLSEGGLTPSLGFLKAAREETSPHFPIFAMIRPRGGNFIYDQAEIQIMETDIKNLKSGGVNGFVFGILTKNKKIDVENCRHLLQIAKPFPVTFHRAFDEVVSPEDDLETLIQLGFSRLLTSGLEKTAEEGKEVICRLVTQADGRLLVMPGSGITPANLAAILSSTKAKEFHGSAKGPKPEDGYAEIVTCQHIVATMKEISKRI